MEFKRKKIPIKNLLLIGFIFISILLILFKAPIEDLDELWNYNLARNIAQGLVPYRDISMVTTPLLSFLNSFFIKIFDQLWMMRILGAILCTGMLYGIYKIMQRVTEDKNASLIITALLGILLRDSFRIDYNILIVVITIFIVYQELKKIESKEEKKKKQLFLGILAGLGILTKQSTGGILAIVVTFLPILEMEKKEEIKLTFQKVFLRGIGVIIPVILLLVYFIFTNSFSGFMDYAVEGIKTFTNFIPYTKLWENELIEVKILAKILPIAFLILISQIIFLAKEKEENKKLILMAIYSLPPLLTIYPIADKIHFLIGIVMLLLTISYDIWLLGKKVFQKITWKNKKKAYWILTLFIWLGLFSWIAARTLTNGYEIYQQQNRNQEIEHYKNLVIQPYLTERIKTIDQFILEQEKQGKKVIILDVEAAVYQIPINHYYRDYDMFLIGNLGKKGEEGQIQKIEQEDENTLYLIRKPNLNQNWQTPKKVIQYIRENKKKIEEISIYEVYQK